MNGKVVQTAHIDTKNPDLQIAKLEIPLGDLHSGSNTVRIEKVRVGTCYSVDRLASDRHSGEDRCR